MTTAQSLHLPASASEVTGASNWPDLDVPCPSTTHTQGCPPIESAGETGWEIKSRLE